MKFLYPLGLLGLLGIPILIAIYIIKNKYTEQVVSSTYLWTLSEKFLKKRLPINKLVGILSLILQICAVLFISVAIARPVFYIRGAANDYCFVLDGSGSMNITQNGSTRLDLAKDEVRKIITESKNGSAYSLVFAGDTTDLIFRDVEDKERALTLLDDVSGAYTSDVFRDALGVAQGIFNDNPSTLTYLVTDREMTSSDNVTVINVSDREENYAISSAEYSFSGGKLTLDGSVISYESGAMLTLELYLNGEETPAAEQNVEVQKGGFSDFKFEYTFEKQNDVFISAKIRIVNADALALDNEITVYNVEYENSYRALIVSDTPFYIHASMLSIGKAFVTAVSTETYASGDFSGYDLYIFDSYTPRELPDAAVWFFNPLASVSGTGFTVQDPKTFDEKVEFDYNTVSTSTLVRTLLKDVNTRDEISIIKYQQCGLYRAFTTVMSHGGNPLVFAGSTESGNREVVFAFSLKDTDLAVNMNFDVLMKNLLEYTFPTVLETAAGYCGDTLRINVIANCDSIRVVAPISGRISYLDTTVAVGEVELTEVGTYSIVITMKDKSSRSFSFYSSLPEEEREPRPQATEAFSIVGEPGTERRSGIYDDLLAFFIILAVVFLADWTVYCYEQYQLR